MIAKSKEEEYLEKISRDKNLKFPVEVRVRLSKDCTSVCTYNNRKAILSELTRKRNAKKGIYSCFFCNHYSKENKGGRFMPMDKRESGDNGFGDTYTCYKCVGKEFGRL